MMTNAKSSNHQRIGGWLILFAVGVVFYPIQNIAALTTELLPAFFHENWSVLTTPGSNQYHALWAPMLIAELIGNIFFLLFSICLLVFFFQRRKLVIKLTVFFLLSNLIFIGSDYAVTQLFLIKAKSINLTATINFVRALTAGGIWIPYFLFSKRVKATFLE